jgi:hypothetical protein
MYRSVTAANLLCGMRFRSLVWGVLALPVLLAPAACGGGSKGDSTTTSTIATTTTLPAMPADFNWWTPAAPVALGRGWTIGVCTKTTTSTSRGKRLCLENEDGREATVEHFRFRAPADGDLNTHAAQFVQDFIEDRKKGCGEAYRVDADPIVALDLKDGPAKRYGFIGGSAGAPDTERTVQWAGIRDGVLVILTLSGYDPGSCIPNTGQGTLNDLDQVIPGLNKLVLASGLPPVQPS